MATAKSALGYPPRSVPRFVALPGGRRTRRSGGRGCYVVDLRTPSFLRPPMMQDSLFLSSMCVPALCDFIGLIICSAKLGNQFYILFHGGLIRLAYFPPKFDQSS